MLTSASANLSASISGSRVSSPISDTIDENPNKLYTYIHQLAGSNEMEVDVILKDHCYARPWNWKPENVYVKPIKRLFFAKKSTALEKQSEDEEVDVEGIPKDTLTPPLDLTRVKHLMDELQRLSSFARPDENNEWEEQIDKLLWSSVQHRIFTKVMKILNSERLSRLARANSPIEPIFRRTSVDIAARRFREALASAGWDWRLAQWLHGLLFDYLPQEYLGIYLDILQTLRLRIPQLIDKMIAVQPNINAKAGSITWETLGSMLKRSWDPIVQSLGSSRLKKLPGNPILIITPSGIGTSMSSRQHKWISLLGTLGMVVTVHSHLGIAANRITMMVCIDQLVQATRTKIQDIRNDCPGRPIILVGFNTGAALACQVAQMEHVSAVICLGFPFSSAEGKRGTPDDTLMDVRCPVMFIIGQNATLVRPDDLEDLREKMLVETSLVVVGTADDNLRISTMKKVSEGITQSMVDRCILDEIGDFVGSILLQPHPLPLRTTLISSYETKNSRKEQRKRRNSTSSSVESEPNSPTAKKSRPNTPISSGVPVTLNNTANVTSKPGSYNAQSALMSVAPTQTGHVATVKRKPRSAAAQKAQYVEHLVTTRMPGQHTVSENGGITLNIGSLASLAPVGPIRLTSTSGAQPTAMIPKSSSKASGPSIKMPKIVTTMPLPTSQKMKVIPMSKGFPKMVSTNYRHASNIDANSDSKHGDVFSTGSQVKLTIPATAMGHNKALGSASSGSMTNFVQNGKNSLPMSGGSPSTRTPLLSNVLLTANSTVANSVTTTAPTTSKVTDSMGATGSSSNAMHNSTISLDTAKMSELPRQVTIRNKNDNLHNAPASNIVMIDNSSNTRNCSSAVVPFSTHNSDSIQSLSSKPKVTNKTLKLNKAVKVMPKITVNASNLQRLQKPKAPQALQKKALANEMDDDLGNILDIPIIFAKDDENINSIEKSRNFSHAGLPDTQDRHTSKLNTGTKVVLISNKQDKLQQSTSKHVTPTTQTIICPSVSMQNLNHVILQTRPQHPTITARPKAGVPARMNQPTIKYTKIILAKRNSQGILSNDKSEPVIVTRTNDKFNTPKLLHFEKNEHRYAQLPPTVVAKNEQKPVDKVLEIEDAIQTNIIERKSVTIPEIDLTSPIKNDDSKKAHNKNIALDANTQRPNSLIDLES